MPAEPTPDQGSGGKKKKKTQPAELTAPRDSAELIELDVTARCARETVHLRTDPRAVTTVRGTYTAGQRSSVVWRCVVSKVHAANPAPSRSSASRPVFSDAPSGQRAT
jgi:hypothetical protein